VTWAWIVQPLHTVAGSWRALYVRAMTADPALAPLARLINGVSSVWRGPAAQVRLVVAAWLARGHVLLEDVPGVGKTTLARALARGLGGEVRRIQGTPDLLPGDITGVTIWDQRSQAPLFRPGPVFAEVLLADELNRTPPRTQAALLEALAEGQVTVDGVPRPLPDRFFCIATQNPHDQAGTYLLPDSERDRFLICLSLGMPSAADELELLRRDGAAADLSLVTPAGEAADWDGLRRACAAVRVDPAVTAYIQALVAATRTARALTHGASPRAAIGLQRAARAWALIAGRRFVLPDDVQALAGPCLAHRLGARAGTDAAALVQSLISAVPVPR
jgi:MoxR-like ATPase